MPTIAQENSFQDVAKKKNDTSASQIPKEEGLAETKTTETNPTSNIVEELKGRL